MRLIKIKAHANICLNTAKKALIENKYTPLCYGITETSDLKDYVIPVRTDEDIQRIPEYLKDLAMIYNTIILVIDLIAMDTDDIDEINLSDEEIIAHPDSSNALTCFIFTECNIFERKLKYSKDSLGNFSDFIDSDWCIKKNDQTKTFLNPYNQINSADPLLKKPIK